MIVTILPDYDTMSRAAARLVADALARKPDLVLGLAAGNTPAGLYRELVRRHLRDGLDFSRVTTFNLDEYLDVPETHPASFRRFTEAHLVGRVNIDRRNAHAPSGATAEACRAYEKAIAAAGGIDLQILGIGENGHIAFNEPGATLASRTRVTSLSPATVAAIRRSGVFYPSEAPGRAVTMGIGTILDARRLILMASGAAKAPAVAAAVEGPVTPEVPASALQRHRDVTVLLDEAAAARLRLHGTARRASA